MIKEHIKYKGYAADEDGNIYNKSAHNKNQPNKDGWRLMNTVKHNNGYHSINVWYDNKIRQISAHKIVYECFHQVSNQYNAMVTDGLTIDHIDGNKSNNNIKNLQLLSHGENSRKGNIGKKMSEKVRKKLSKYWNDPKWIEKQRQNALNQKRCPITNKYI